jgi:hypothetical protein
MLGLRYMTSCSNGVLWQWLVCLCLAVWAPGCHKVCEAGATQLCYCTTGEPGAQSCTSDGKGWSSCQCTPSDGDADGDSDADGDADADTEDDADPDGPCRTDESCADGLFCNGAERCAEGVCLPGEPPDCDDDDMCTTDSCSDEEGACVHDVPSQWLHMDSGTDWKLRGIWGSGPDDVFVVGDNNSAYSGESIILHWDGTSWEPMDHERRNTLNDVWGRGPDDVYAAGRGGVLHYDGSQWETIHDNLFIEAIWGTPEGYLYAVGDPERERLEDPGKIWRFDGSIWEEIIIEYEPGQISDSSLWYTGVWAQDTNNIFVTHDRYHLVYYDGEQWNFVEAPNGEYLVWSFNAIWGSSASDVYAVSWGNTILHYDGERWDRVRRTGLRVSLEGIFGTAPDRIFVVGDSATVLSFNGSSWRRLSYDENRPSTCFEDVWASPEGDLFVVGYDGEIRYYCGEL